MGSTTKRGRPRTPTPPSPAPSPVPPPVPALATIPASDRGPGGDEEVAHRRCAHPGCGKSVPDADWAYRSVVCTILEYGPEPLETQFHPRETRYYCCRRHAYAAIGW